MEIYRLSDVLPNLDIDGSIFKQFEQTYGLTAFQLGLEYFNRSGDKAVSKLVRKYIDENTGTVTAEGEARIGMLLYDMFKNNWDHIYEAITSDYNPIENYNMVEHGTDKKGAQTDTMNYGQTQTTNSIDEVNTTNKTGATTTTNDYGVTSSETEHEVSAFNSTSYQDDTKDTQTINEHIDTTGTSERNDSSHVDSRVDTVTESSHMDTNTEGERTDVHDFTRTGNVGVQTTQEMIQKSVDLYQYNFYEQIYADIDKILTIPLYI